LEDVQLLADVHQAVQDGLAGYMAGYAAVVLKRLLLPHVCNHPTLPV
jgi:hypothetical protein